MNFLCSLSKKFRLYKYFFNTVKSVLVDLKKKTPFLSRALFFHVSDKKIYRKKLVAKNCPFFQIFKKLGRKTRTIFELYIYFRFIFF